MRRLPVIIFCVVALVFAQSAPTLQPLPDYVRGTTCQIRWNLPPGASPTAYHIQVMQAESGFPAFPSTYTDPYISIYPVPTSLAPGYYTVGLDELGGCYADDPLNDGIRYCYRIQYRYDGPDSSAFSAWSNIVCARQDNSAPVVRTDTVTTERLWGWTNTVSVNIGYWAVDRVCQWVDRVNLYYRDTTAGAWSYAGFDIAGGNGITGIIPFNSADHGGDGYYEFYLVGVDSMGNEVAPSSSSLRHTWTRFDTNLPEANLITTGLRQYYNVTSIQLPFLASDTYSGVKDVHLKYSCSGGPITTYATRSYGGALSVNDTFVFATTTNGRYGIYLQAVDSALNEEPLLTEEAYFFIDTRSPQFSGVLAVDTTSASHRYDVRAESGYTNMATIYVFPLNAHDPVLDGYASQIESVYVAQSSDFEENLRVYPYVADSFLYLLTHGDGAKQVYIKLRDRAGNYSNVWSSTIIYDSDAPSLNSVVLCDRIHPAPTDTTHDMTVYVVVNPSPTSTPFYKVFLTQNQSALNNIPESGWQDYDDTLIFTFTGFSIGSWMKLWAVVKDSAGNVSNAVMDSIYLGGGMYAVDITAISDPDGPDFSGRYTNSTTVNVSVNYGRNVDSLALWAQGDTPIFYHTVRPAGSDTTITFVHTFSPGDGIRKIYAQGKNIHEPLPTNKDSISIVLDTQRPLLRGISVRDISTAYDPSDTSEPADLGYTNKTRVRVTFNDPSDERTGIYHNKVVCETVELENPYTVNILFDLPSGDGGKQIRGFVQDSAGNWSIASETLITLDTRRPTISSVTLRDRTDLSADFTDEDTVLVELSASDGGLGQPAYVAFFENPSRWPNNLSTLWRPYSTIMSYGFEISTPGQKRVYVAVKDRAGNISLMTYDDIVLNTYITFEISLYNPNRGRAYQNYVNTPTVGMFFVPHGTPPAYYIASVGDSAIQTVLPDDPRWLEFPNDSSALITVPAVEGVVKVCARLKSVSGTISPIACDSIVLDMTPPILPNGFVLYDTTSADNFPTRFKAHIGWTNEPWVRAVISSATDNLSGVDSLRYLGPFTGTWQPVNYTTISGGIQVAYPNPTVSLVWDASAVGSYAITGSAHDQAGNWTDIVLAGGYDTERPQLTIVPFHHPDTATLPSSIPMIITDSPDGGHLWKVCYRVADLGLLECAEYAPEWGTYPNFNVKFPLDTILDPHQLYVIEVVAVDSAGNSSVPETLNLWSKIGFYIVDPNDTDDRLYTGSRISKAVIDASVPPDSMRIAETQGALASAQWVPFVRMSDFAFSNNINEQKTAYAQVKFKDFISPVAVAHIILDTIPPTVSSIVAMDRNTEDPTWSGEREVKIEVVGASDPPPGVVNALLVAEDPSFTCNPRVLYLNPSDPVVYYEVSEEACVPESPTDDLLSALRSGRRKLYAKVLDHAENASSVVSYEIIVDWETAQIVAFPNPFNPNDGVANFIVKGAEPGSNIELKIFDMFGNPVWSKKVSLSGQSRATVIEWDGKNEKGDIVANGGYICIIDIGGKVQKSKIAVWKGQ